MTEVSRSRDNTVGKMAKPLFVFRSLSTNSYRALVLVVTFWAYTSYHLSRKPISIVKSVLGGDCNKTLIEDCGWAPFDGEDSKLYLGLMDYTFLFAYAFGIFISGHIAERVDLRYFLTAGMILSGIFTVMFGVGFYLNIHSIWYYVAVQIIVGLFESTGWPAIVACVANWFGKGRRGLIMGIWNCHTSVGNILGALIAAVWVNHVWGLSFIVPGACIGFMGIVVFLFLVPKPQDIGCTPPDHGVIAATPQPTRRVNVTESDEFVDSDSDVPFGGTAKSDSSDCEQPHSSYDDSTCESDPLVNSMRKDTSEEEEPEEEPQAIKFSDAVRIPGVLEFSFCLFFAKLVSYTFLFWLPEYITNATTLDPKKAANLSTVFDVGGAFGGIITGLISDITGGRATTCAIMLTIAAPMMFVYQQFGGHSIAISIVLLFITGGFVNGPYALITTAVSADLGTHPSLQGNKAALATVTAIIDGTGSIGAAIGPLLTSVLTQHFPWNSVFYMLIAANVCALLLLSRLVSKEISNWRRPNVRPGVLAQV